MHKTMNKSVKGNVCNRNPRFCRVAFSLPVFTLAILILMGVAIAGGSYVAHRVNKMFEGSAAAFERSGLREQGAHEVVIAFGHARTAPSREVGQVNPVLRPFVGADGLLADVPPPARVQNSLLTSAPSRAALYASADAPVDLTAAELDASFAEALGLVRGTHAKQQVEGFGKLWNLFDQLSTEQREQARAEAMAKLTATESGSLVPRKVRQAAADLLVQRVSVNHVDYFNYNNIRGLFTSLDLSDADFRGADLRGSDFRGANLNGADFSDAKIAGADFTDARMRGVRMILASAEGANFGGALLDGADLSLSNLSGAEFQGAHLRSVSLTGADLRDANMAGATFLNTEVTGADLSSAKNMTQAMAANAFWRRQPPFVSEQVASLNPDKVLEDVKELIYRDRGKGDEYASLENIEGIFNDFFNKLFADGSPLLGEARPKMPLYLSSLSIDDMAAFPRR